MWFTMINENFLCENCGKEISKHPTGSARNHCPYCLFSKHLDDTIPWDRASICKGLMAPSGVDFRKNKWWMIKHTCKKCGKVMVNKIAPDDYYVDFIKTLKL